MEHSSIMVAAIQTQMKKIIVAIPYGIYTKLPKVTMICL